MVQREIIVENSYLDFGAPNDPYSITVDSQDGTSVNPTVEIKVTFKLILKILQTHHTCLHMLLSNNRFTILVSLQCAVVTKTSPEKCLKTANFYAYKP